MTQPLPDLLAELDDLGRLLPRAVDIDEQDLERGLAQLVLTVVDVLRELLERQALRRMESGSLTDDEVERLGRTFLALRARIEELAGAFGLDTDDLRLDLGPLGRL